MGESSKVDPSSGYKTTGGCMCADAVKTDLQNGIENHNYTKLVAASYVKVKVTLISKSDRVLTVSGLLVPLVLGVTQSVWIFVLVREHSHSNLVL